MSGGSQDWNGLPASTFPALHVYILLVEVPDIMEPRQVIPVISFLKSSQNVYVKMVPVVCHQVVGWFAMWWYITKRDYVYSEKEKERELRDTENIK